MKKVKFSSNNWTFLRPELADKMAKSTYNEMQEFLKYQHNNKPVDNWQNIENQVKNFNRSTIINDPKSKGNILNEK